MKKILLSIASMAFIIGVNAQVQITPIKEAPHQEPKSKSIILPPKDEFKMTQKAFEKVGWITSLSYLGGLMGENQLTQYNQSLTGMTLLPDTCLTVYAKDIFSPGLIGMGFVLDPYSPVFSDDFTTGLFPTPPEFTYNYRLDTISFHGLYYLGTKGYDAASPDTLRIYFTSVAPYRGNKDHYMTVYMNGHADTMYLIPKITVEGANQTKGATIIPTSPNTVCIDYILQEGDTVYKWDSAETSWMRWSSFEIPLTLNGVTQNGFEVPYGDALSVMVHFIPGYDYELGDTLYWGEVVGDEWADGYPIRVNNQFSLRYGTLQDVDNEFADPIGFNNPTGLYREHRYQMFEGTAAFLNECYYPMPNSLPYMWFALSVDEENGGVIDVQVMEANDIVSKIYPNPAKDNLTINLKSSERATIKLYNILGQEVKSTSSNNMQTTMNVSDLHAGIYIVKIDQNGQSFTTKINIQ